MTADYLVTEIFSRPQGGIASNIRRLTIGQFVALRALMLKEDKGDVRHGDGSSLVWTPKGGAKYVLTEDGVRAKYTLTRLSAIEQSGSGMLFG
jgi:hypothetical protein